MALDITSIARPMEGWISAVKLTTTVTRTMAFLRRMSILATQVKGRHRLRRNVIATYATVIEGWGPRQALHTTGLHAGLSRNSSVISSAHMNDIISKPQTVTNVRLMKVSVAIQLTLCAELYSY